ncbi:polar amino acid ABC transporter permease [Mesotoga sp. Brook.08.YT.4.2.5.1]|uniref:amino acid ABC transporter permease n=1 Tax=unclassified Mesotoga TaxID=1184398 RepID=UPI000A9C8F15|nr:MULTISPECIES: amino acid ABC transporter permease [unclassified Mesotoga]PXF34970.1 polar amino acid ABC transporter permease [Mesotoga sp. SC_NapDC]RAM60531.1 polar amino acid ABC transporter permease [Mesotoga sp. SC_4PWA21]MDD3461097.1 amino acid ABC transporter permease [Mesotoga sp.]PNE19876.1 polar amino acid ABC transporter permease [Mesotoga sp. Brook.08.YT.4.2.5.1]PVD18208.1 polar amino acid ABC transporter permease [Mesotoga sp. Brook.08.105.5.1]
MPALLRGLWVTLQITFLTLGLGLILALPISFGQVYGNKWLKVFIAVYEKVLRSIPELVILFLIFYGFPRIGIRFSPFAAVVIGLGFRSSAYQSQIFRGAINSVSSTQMRAARSLGMTNFNGFINVVLPQAVRIALPPWTNEFTIVLKDSSLAYALGVTELLRQGGYIIATKYEPMLIYLTVAAMYFVVTIVINKSLGSVEKRLAVPGFDIKETVR